MMKTIIKYTGIGLGVLIILAFAIYFTFKGPDVGGSEKKHRAVSEKAKSSPVTEIPGDDDFLPGTLTEDEMAKPGDIIRMPDIILEDSDITWDVYGYFDEYAGLGDNSYEIFILHNTTQYDMDLYLNIEYRYDDGDPQINSIYINNFAADSDYCIWTMPANYSEREITYTAKRQEDGTFSINNKLVADYIDNGNGISGTVKNESGCDAWYVEATVLFLDGDNVVCMENINLYTGDEYIPDGGSKEFSVSGNGKEYNEIKIFFSGMGKE